MKIPSYIILNTTKIKLNFKGNIIKSLKIKFKFCPTGEKTLKQCNIELFTL